MLIATRCQPLAQAEMNKTLITIILFPLLIFVCFWGHEIYQFGNGVIQDAKDGKNKTDTIVNSHIANLNYQEGITGDNLILTETNLGSIDLNSLNGSNIDSIIKSNYKSFQIKKEIGQQDGPNFKLYNVRIQNEDFFFISMDTFDSLLVQDIWTNNPKIKDKYGVHVSSSIQDVIQQRENLQFHSDLHYNIYASTNGSKISYRLSGNFKSLNDSLLINKDYSVNKNQITEMEVEYIIWKK